MASSLPDSERTFDFDTDPAPSRKVTPAQVDQQLDVLHAYLNNQVKRVLDGILRSDDSLKDGIALVRHLSQELRDYIQSYGGGQAGESGTFGGIDVTREPYSATGDGTTDDTAALQAALDAAVTARTNVLIPSGSYKLTAALTLTGDYIPSIIGIGLPALIQSNDAVFAIDYNFNGGEVHAQGVKWSGFQIYAKNGIRIQSAESYDGNPASAFGLQAVVLGLVFDGLFIYGEYGTLVDPNYNNPLVDATHDELKGYGVGIKMSKTFNWRVINCWIGGWGIGMALYGCDIGGVQDTRIMSNARHAHIRGMSTFGSTTTFLHCDLLINWRMDGFYMDACNDTQFLSCYHENFPGMSYFGSANDTETTLLNTRIASFTEYTVPWCRFNPQSRLRVTSCKWDRNGFHPPAIVGTAYWSNFGEQDLATFTDNDPGMPLPEQAGVRLGDLDPTRLDYRNWERFSGDIANSFPWTKTGDIWHVKPTVGVNAVFVMTLPANRFVGNRRVRLLWRGKYVTGGGDYSVQYRLSRDTGSLTDLSVGQSIGFLNDGTYQEKARMLTLPDPGTAEVIQLWFTVGQENILLQGLQIIEQRDPLGLTYDWTNDRNNMRPSHFTHPDEAFPTTPTLYGAHKIWAAWGQLGGPQGLLVGGNESSNGECLLAIRLNGGGNYRGYTVDGGGGVYGLGVAGGDIAIVSIDGTINFYDFDIDPLVSNGTPVVGTRVGFSFEGRWVFGIGRSDDGTSVVQVGGDIALDGNVILRTTGMTLILPSTGAAPTIGTVTLVAGSATVACTLVDANARIFLQRQNDSGTLGVREPRITKNNGVGFTITSDSALETSTYDWVLFRSI